MTTDHIVLTTMVLLAVLGCALVWLSATGRLSRSQQGGRVSPVPCAYRRRHLDPWARGTLYYAGNRLDHYGGGTLTPPLLHRWRREALDLRQARTVPATDVPVPACPAGVVVVDCGDGHHDFELALGTDHYTALRAWLEAVPPGWNANRA